MEFREQGMTDLETDRKQKTEKAVS